MHHMCSNNVMGHNNGRAVVLMRAIQDVDALQHDAIQQPAQG